jgi:2-phospho-L-lactate guanylyltransferase
MTIWAIVPVKPLQRAKSRLSNILTQSERASLSRKLLKQTLKVLAQVPAVEQTLVISRDSEALALARGYDAKTVTERGSPQLNKALVRASLIAQGYGVTAVLVLPADLPLLIKEDVEKLIASSGSPPEVVIAPDRRGTGTNAILSSPPGLIEYDFGSDSFSKHVARAEKAGARVVICDLPSLGLDLDDPDDFAAYQAENTEINLSKEQE